MPWALDYLKLGNPTVQHSLMPQGQKRKAATPAARAVDAAKKQKGGAQPGGGKPSNLQAAAKAEVKAKAAGKAATPSIASFLGQRRDDVPQVPAKKNKPTDNLGGSGGGQAASAVP